MLKRRTLSVVLAAAVLLAMAPVTGAGAQENCRFEFYTDADGNEHLIWTCTEGGSGGGGEGEGGCTTIFDGREIQVPCIHSVHGWFTASHGGCYIRPTIPQPAADDPAWEGHDPAEELLYIARCFGLEGVDGRLSFHDPIMLFFPAGEGPVGDLIERAIALLELRGADIGIAPDPAGAGLVGLPVWMWTEPTVSTWGPAEAELTALDVTVDVEANAQRIVWAMGDGQSVECLEPGTPYEASYGADRSPTCGYDGYQQPSRSNPDGKYHITATTHWLIEWQIRESVIRGTRPTTRQESTSVRINELQVVTS